MKVILYSMHLKLILYCMPLKLILFYGIANSKKYVIKIPCLPYFWWVFIEACSFSAFNFCQYLAEFFLSKLS